MSSLYESLKSYFENTPADVLERDKKEVEYLNEIGPDVLEYAEYVKEYFGIKLSCAELDNEKALKYDFDKKMGGYSGNPQYYFAAQYMEKASFRLDSYRFIKAEMDFNIPKGTELCISFSPKGTYHSENKLYELNFDVVVKCPEVDKDVIKVSCVANFSFDQIDTIGQIPDYFYPNSLAILFPYVRAFVSTISLQANVQPIVLPTINLMGITAELKNNTVVVNSQISKYMRNVDIYQTLEDRHNYEYIKEHGPFFCSNVDKNGNIKKGLLTPWLGEGYYFWDTREDDAHWWGQTVYKQSGYVICHTAYDQHSDLLFDMVGNISQFDDFIKCARYIKSKEHHKRVSFPMILARLKKMPNFIYKAVRVWPQPKEIKSTNIEFPGNKFRLGFVEKIQICFFDKTLLVNSYNIIYPEQTPKECQTI